jgi:hypothetical protein
MRLKHSKRGALELSMNAIIIIILAITMLVLALGFIRTFMGKGTDSLNKIMIGIDTDTPPTSNIPFVIDKDITLRSSAITPVKIGFYCQDPVECTAVKPVFTVGNLPNTAGTGSCIKATSSATTITDTGTTTIKINTLDATMSTNTGETFLTQWETGSLNGDYICRVSIANADSPPVIYQTTQVNIHIK